MSIIYFILVLFVIVLVHEWGHYKTAKLFGARVDEFGFGYPPKIATLFKRGETVFTLNALPFGGFVKIFGEDAVSQDTDTTRALYKKPKWQQAVVLSAGVFMNIVLAWVIFLFLFLNNSEVVSSFVDRQYVTDEKVIVTDVVKNFPSEQAGLRKGDVILQARTTTDDLVIIDSQKSLRDFVQSTNGESFSLLISRNENKIPIFVTPEEHEGLYKIGLDFNTASTIRVPKEKAVLYSFTATKDVLVGIVNGLGHLFTSLFSKDTESVVEVSGPIGIVKTIGDASRFGFEYVLSLTALISLNLAVLNILPIPALDGGRLIFLLIEKITGKPIHAKTATRVHTTSFIILVALMLVVTFFDIFKLFK